jgi:hypothetical protein
MIIGSVVSGAYGGPTMGSTWWSKAACLMTARKESKSEKETQRGVEGLGSP